VYSSISKRLEQLCERHGCAVLDGCLVGLEKESLRVTSDGSISQIDHPAVLGSALCHTAVTTDFSEALLEMVTPPCPSSQDALNYLQGIHEFVASRLPAQEMLWNASMPCILKGESSIRIGEYGTSHSATMKHVYRRGLALRYGRMMQAIAGIHFNFSIPDNFWQSWSRLHGMPTTSAQVSRTAGYFHMTRGWMRIGWVVPYLFGASPAICESFLGDARHDSDLERLNEHTRYARYGTSLRMGNIGYRYREDSGVDLSVSHERFAAYMRDLHQHVTTPHPAYNEKGLKDSQQQYQQLNTNRLQIENEFYSSIRPKQIPIGDEMPLTAMQNRGIRYLELRSIDVNPFEATGLTVSQLAFLEVLMIFTALMDPAPQDADAVKRAKHNIETVAHRGREPGLRLQTIDGAITLNDWGKHLIDALVPIARCIDKQQGTNLYAASVEQQRQRFEVADRTPSAAVLDAVNAQGSFYGFVMEQSQKHHSSCLNATMNEPLNDVLTRGASDSTQKQAQLEVDTQGEFPDYLANRFEQLNQPMSSPLIDAVDAAETHLNKEVQLGARA